MHIPSTPGYTIPLIDLAFDASRQTVVDRQPAQYLGHPSAVLLDDGRTLIAVYPKGHGRGVLVMKCSEDGGRTWGGRLPTPHNWDTSQETPTLYRTIDSQGIARILLFSGAMGLGNPIRMAVSEDDGRTWSQLKPIGNYSGSVAMADMVRLKDGRYMAFFHGLSRRFIGEFDDPGKISPDYLKEHPEHPAANRAAQAPPPRAIYKVVSADGGLTWGEPEIATRHPSAGICEPGLVRSPDGSQLAMLLRENSRTCNSFVSFSNDEGATWSDPRELPASLTGDRHQACYAPDGRLFISFRDTTRESLTKGDWVAWVGTYQDIVEDREGQYRVRLMQNLHGMDCGYPALKVLADGTIVAITYGHFSSPSVPHIAAVHLRIEELDSLPKWRLV